MSSIAYYCPCSTSISDPPPPAHLLSSSYSYHPLSDLYFCEECDAVRCNRCVSIEVAGYYCPNCLFEVPSASVRAEKNRCARNCFLCPHCRNTLAVVPSDPEGMEWDTKANPPALGALNDPPFLLYCNSCRWDSAEVGIQFDKPTGLAVQMQKYEDSAPESLEFERLKEHFEPYLRNQLASSTSSQPHQSSSLNPITAAASTALSRDVPGLASSTRTFTRTKSHSGTGKGGAGVSMWKEDLPPYRSRIEMGFGLGSEAGDVEENVEFMSKLEEVNEVAPVELRWLSSWTPSLSSSDLLPLRMPLHSKKSKRCHICRHILIKPEQKAQSVRYKIKLVAANYLPSISLSVILPTPPTPFVPNPTLKRSGSTKPEEETKGLPKLHAGRTYAFKMALTNPMYDPISVKLSTSRSQSTTMKPLFAVSLPTTSFTINAFQEAWEYEDEDGDIDMIDAKEKERESKGRGKNVNVGLLEKKANTSVVGGEVVISKGGEGEVKFIMNVSYTYRSDDLGDGTDASPRKSGAAASGKISPEMKTFSFATMVTLGSIVPREGVDAAVTRRKIAGSNE